MRHLITGIYDLDCLDEALENVFTGKTIRVLIRP